MMRSAALAMLLLLAAALAAAQEWSVEVNAPRMQLVRKEELVIRCRTDRPILGCTELRAEELSCQCRRTDGAWSIAAHAQFAPSMYVIRPDVENHERLHIEDLRAQIGVYLAELTARRFDDGESCRSTAEFETAVFRLRLDLFRKLSQQKLH